MGSSRILRLICAFGLRVFPQNSEFRVIRSLTVISAISVSLAANSGCRNASAVAEGMTGGNPGNGRHLLYSYGCGSCHKIPGVGEADGTIGPPLGGVGSRMYIAGLQQNTLENLVRWIAQPQEVQPGNAMPDLGVTEEQARDIAAYLYTLH